jgi:hypothetical protein
MAVGLWVMATLCTAMVDVILDGVTCEMGRAVAQAKAGAFQVNHRRIVERNLAA